MILSLILASANLVGPLPPPEQNLTQDAIQQKLDEVKRVADGTFSDAVLIGVGSGFDMYMTEKCIVENPGCYESIGVNQVNGTARLALKGGLYPAKVGACYYLRRLGKHKLARALALGFFSIDTYAGYKNFKNSRKGIK